MMSYLIPIVFLIVVAVSLVSWGWRKIPQPARKPTLWGLLFLLVVAAFSSIPWTGSKGADQKRTEAKRAEAVQKALATFDADAVRQKYTPKDWEPMPSVAKLDQTEFPRGQMSQLYPTRLNMALMMKPSLNVEAPALHGRMRYCWPELWIVSGRKRVLTMQKTTTIETYKLDGMSHLSFTTKADSTLPKPLDVQLTLSDAADGRHHVRIAAYKILNPHMEWVLRPKDPRKPDGEKEWKLQLVDNMARWGVIPPAREHKRQLYVRFSYPDGRDIESSVMQQWPFMADFRTANGKTTTLRIYQAEKYLTTLLPNEASALTLVVPQIRGGVRIEVIASYEPKP